MQNGMASITTAANIATATGTVDRCVCASRLLFMFKIGVF
jgi:hypothetical protein